MERDRKMGGWVKDEREEKRDQGGERFKPVSFVFVVAVFISTFLFCYYHYYYCVLCRFCYYYTFFCCFYYYYYYRCFNQVVMQGHILPPLEHRGGRIPCSEDHIIPAESLEGILMKDEVARMEEGFYVGAG